MRSRRWVPLLAASGALFLGMFGLAPTPQADAQAGTSKTCGPDSGGNGGNCFLEAPGFPGGRVTLSIDSDSDFTSSIPWRVVNLKGGGPICNGSYVPAESPHSFTCYNIPAGTVSVDTAQPPTATTTIALRW